MNFITNNVWTIIVVILIFLFVVLLINYRKALAKKIKREPISFTAMTISLSIALITLLSKPKPIPAEVLAISGREGIISLAIPITGFFVVLSVIFAFIFFRKKKKGKR